MSHLPRAQYVSQLLSSNGDGTGQTNMNGDYSSTPGIFYYRPGLTEGFYPNRFMIQIQDTGAFDVEKYGNGVSLVAGITLDSAVAATGTIVDTLTPHPIHNNGDWGLYCYDIAVHTFGTGDEMLLARWTLGKAVPPTFDRIAHDNDWPRPMTNASRVQITLRDNLTGLNFHRVLVQGMKITNYVQENHEEDTQN